MNVSIQTNVALSRTIKVEITKDDYAESCKKSLHKLRQQTILPGFRKGMAPLALLEKKYGKDIKAEEIDKLIREGVAKGIKDNNLNVLGQAVPNETDKPINFDNDDDIEFSIDVALYPEITTEFTKDDHLPWYKIKVEDEAIDDQIDTYRRDYGTYERVEAYEHETDMLKGTLTELEGIVPKEDGVVVEDAVLAPMYFKDKTEKSKFAGAKTGDRIIFNPFAAYAGMEAPLAALLHIEKEKAKDMTGDFTYEIIEIEHYKESELNEKFYAKLFGEGVVKDEADFREKMRGVITNTYANYSQQRFAQDAFELLKEKANEISLADSVLKRCMPTKSENPSQEDIEHDYIDMADHLKRQLIIDKIMQTNGLTVEDEDLNSYARHLAYQQWQSHSMYQPTEDILDYFVADIKKNEQNMKNLTELITLDKVTASIQEQITLDEQEVTITEFAKLTESNESNELTESAETTESAELTEMAETTETTELTESNETAETTESAESTE